MTDQLNVSERARDAAAALAQWHNEAAKEWETVNGGTLQFFTDSFPSGLRDGAWDGHELAQAFARFEQPLLDRVRELEAENTRLRAAVERFVADYDDNDRADAGCSALMEMHVRDFRAALTTAPPAPVNRLRRILKGWADWYRLATADDDNEYLNGKGWDDAEALEDMTLAALWDQSTSQENRNGK